MVLSCGSFNCCLYVLAYSVGEMTTENAVIEMYRAIDLFLENKFADAEELAKTW